MFTGRIIQKEEEVEEGEEEVEEVEEQSVPVSMRLRGE